MSNPHPYKKHAVVAVNPDGSVGGYFDSIKQAHDLYGMDRHSITDSCKVGSICRGFRWYYEEDFREIYLDKDKLKYTLDPDRDRITYHFKKGHHHGNGWKNRSEESRTKFREEMKKVAIKNLSHPRFGKGRPQKAVKNITTGEIYSSIKECSTKTGIPYPSVIRSLKLGKPTNGFRFDYSH